MNKSILQQTLMKLTLLIAFLWGAMSVASAQDRFYIDTVTIEQGEINTLAFFLENYQRCYGFQADISLPDGLEIVTTNGKPDITLSSRADASYTIVSNMLSNNKVRLGAFSTTHTALSGYRGALFYIKVKADYDFAGGTLAMTNAFYAGQSIDDVEFDDYSIQLVAISKDTFYIPDFRIAVGESKTIGVILDNKTTFTAFQTDIYLPEGLTIVDNSFAMTARAGETHSITTKSFSDGRTRVACFASSNETFSGNSGVLLEFEMLAEEDIAQSCTIEMKNQLFSTATAKEYVLPNSTTDVTLSRTSVREIILNPSQAQMKIGETMTLSAVVYPSYATNKEIEWVSSDHDVAAVSSSGEVTALNEGMAVITAWSTDGSAVYATCYISVTITADVEAASLDDIQVAVVDRHIVITGLMHGSVARLYTPGGVLLKSAKSDGGETIFEISPKTYYILNIGPSSLKIFPQ